MSPANDLNTSLNGLPLWTKAIATLGFPITVALILLLAMLGIIPDKAMQRYEQVIKAHQALAYTTDENNGLLRQNQAIMLQNGQISFALCVNLAKDSVERDRCLKAERGEHP